MDRPKAIVCAVLISAGLLLAGCGGGDEETSSSTTTTGATGATGELGAAGVPLDGPPDPALTVAELVPYLPLPEPVVDDPGFKESLEPPTAGFRASRSTA